MEIIEHVKNIQYGYLLNNNKMGHLEGNFTPVLYMGRKVPKGQSFENIMNVFKHRTSDICHSQFDINGAYQSIRFRTLAVDLLIRNKQRCSSCAFPA